MSSEIEWKPVMKGGKLIGTIGFIDGQIAVVVSFYDGQDANKDGKVDWKESAAAWAGGFLSDALKTLGLQEVINAYAESGYIDPSERIELIKETKRNAMKVGVDLTIKALLEQYLSKIVGLLGEGLAAKLVKGDIKDFIVKKSFEESVKKLMEKQLES